MENRYNKYATFLRLLYGEKVWKIPVSLNVTCPNRDGTKGLLGCTFCNNESFSPSVKNVALPVKSQVDIGIRNAIAKKRAKKFIVYFQSYSNSYGKIEDLLKWYSEALHPSVVELSIGTRPDCISSEFLDRLAILKEVVNITLELGVESMQDTTLSRVNRCHTVEDSITAINLISSYEIPVCAHMILGFPWENESEIISSAKELSHLPLTFLKLHQLHIVKNTKLEEEYMSNPFHMLSIEEYFNVLSTFLRYTNRNFIIQRLFGNAQNDYLIAPKWERSASELTRLFEKYLEEKGITQGDLL